MDSEIDAKTFWKAIGCRAIGVAIVIGQGSRRAGGLPGAVGHPSFRQPAHDAGVDRPHHLGAGRGQARQPLRHQLRAQGRDDLAKEFGGGGALKGADRFKPGDWTELKTGAPTLVDAVGVIDCRLEEMIERHGTVIALGRVVAYSASTRDPLISFRGGYL